ncbi:hypothetical protein BJ742DRAFT_414104 [Cladochytrium replicatum]|nr:hypothetical protein BJ742DRAFT_414104 [Cladochytrium replicatum]
MTGFDFKSNEKLSMNSVDLLYYCNAESRYIQWIDYLSNNLQVNRGTGLSLLPPLDVAMFWTAHMLNPIAYASDSDQYFGGNNNFSFPLLNLHNLWNGNSHTAENISSFPWFDLHNLWTINSESERTFWDVSASPTYDHSYFYIKRGNISTVTYTCLWCNNSAKYPADKYLIFRTKSGSLKCKICSREFTIEHTSVRMFLNDLENVDKDNNLLPNSKEMKKLCNNFPGVKSALLKLASKRLSELPDWKSVTDAIKGNDNYYYYRRNLAKKSEFVPILKNYQNRLFKFSSIDLIAAVFRQRRFIRHIASGSVDVNTKSIDNAILRYHRFLMLMKENQTAFLVPTRDIDICWHTHQLFPKAYQDYGISLVGKIIEHDDSASNTKLDTGASLTSQLWEDTYGEAYYVRESESKSMKNIDTENDVVPSYVKTTLDSLGMYLQQKEKEKQVKGSDDESEKWVASGLGGTNAFFAGSAIGAFGNPGDGFSDFGFSDMGFDGGGDFGDLGCGGGGDGGGCGGGGDGGSGGCGGGGCGGGCGGGG